MTNINNNSFTKSSRGSDTWTDNLTVNESTNPRAAPSADPGRSSQKSQFAEHLTAQAPKTGAVARPAQQPPVRPQSPRPAAPLKAQPVQQEQATPRQPAPTPRRMQKSEPTEAPWNRSAPDTTKTLEAAVRTPGPRPENAKETIAAKPSLNMGQTPVRAPAAEASAPLVTATASIITNTVSEVPTEAMPEALEDWQLRLQEMLATGNPELFMQQNPALALLAGRLEFVEPAQIPGLVAQSPLLQSILSQTQTADVLQVAMPLEQNLQLLGLAPQALQAKNAGPISLAGIEAPTQEPLVTLGETLQALGFDTRRIMQEGDLLKDNLGLDGLQSYMQRAERMQSSLGLPVQWPTLSPDQTVITVPQKTQINPAAPQALDPALMAQLSRLDPKGPSPLEPVQLWTQDPETAELMPLTVLDDGSAPFFINPMEAGVETWDPFAATTEPKVDATLTAAPTMDEVPLVMNVLPRVPTAPQDPFMVMAQRWNTETLQTLRPEDFVSRESKEIAVDPKTAAAQPLRSLDDLLNSQFIQAPDFANRMDASNLPAPDASPFDLSALGLAFQEAGSTGDDKGGDLSGRNQNQSFLNQDNNSMFTPGTSPAAASNKAFSIETAAAPQAPSVPVSHQQLQDILDKSSMLIKDGGGSIRLDLGSKEMGPLDLALDIKDKTVEIRIVTHSDQAREALVQELPKLRESLQNQNLNLEKVEIGLSYSSAWSQSSGNGQQNREQFFENSSESNSRGPNGIRSTSRSYRQSFVSAPETRVPLHNGLIQVRV
ncbi:MAG TPA: flagellar hook-length control protein FliK [Oligoflexus sp.]|uniref:flagellar hook-length control protein FliK n=1 Tax=Oligoflexus sp. TaxID=1971216 RepID=UPI002D7EB1E7|nr:flagellar hook-length control protein FliK [Oligoflexus sp.]HET9241356.1 flagellar hook-length control protein FliK [Oligoflexus sp.]